MKIGYKTAEGGIKKIVDRNLMHRLTDEKKFEFQFRSLDIDKDRRWNAKKINAEMLQAIENGEDISKMSERLQRVTDMNKVSAVRNARTMTTSFENLGRLEGMYAMQADGTVLKKQWLATHDSRTRDAHAELDGETAETQEPFRNEIGEIYYPGDPTANPSNVYNCRCTLTYVIERFMNSLPRQEIYVYQDKEEAKKVKYKSNVKKETKYKIKLQNKETIKLTGKGLQYGDLDRNIDKKTRDRMEHFENKWLYRSEREQLMSLSNVGGERQVARFSSGSTESTAFMRGDVVTHIHPREKGILGGTFSNPDIAAFITSDAKTMRAVAKEGTYSITKKAGFKGEQLYEDYLKEKVRLESMSNEISASRRMNDFLVESHDWLLKNQKKYGYFYTLEMRGGMK